ncbi:MAG: aspartate/glutamate racemase family protein [Rhodocyclaceae bacterium]|nr:aspartate/glutamate racemase family protein [Rhodocyclaceae bacterium]
MPLLGIIGGMSWESTATYYRLLNEGVKARLGGLHSARLVVHSVDFATIEACQAAGDWDGAGAQLADAAAGLARAGAEAILIATNTMHKVAGAVEAASGLPLIHIADATAAAIRSAGLSHVALLGTRYTMEQDFYRGRLLAHGLDVRTPGADARAEINRVIYEELCLGRCEAASRSIYREAVARLLADGAEGVILGCTEIGLLIGPDDVSCPVFDTTAIHAEAGVRFALDGVLPPAPER